MAANPDFSGYATKANLRCNDGRTISADAFKEQNGARVPLVWQHDIDSPMNVIGYAELEHRADGTYCRGYFNETETGQHAKKMVMHGDITSLSIRAGKLVEKSKTVLHGLIREVSLVLAGANPGALIDNIGFVHGDGSYSEAEDEADIYTGEEIVHGDASPEIQAEEQEEEETVVQHADTSGGETVQDIFNSMSEKQQNVVAFLVQQAATKGSDVKHSDAPFSQEEIEAIVQELNETQADVMHALVDYATEHPQTDAATADDTDNAGEALADTDTAETTAVHSDTEEGTTMARNAFENNEGTLKHGATSPLTQAQEAELFHDALESGARSFKHYLKTYVKSNKDELAHAMGGAELTHGINDIEVLFPDARSTQAAPEWLSRRTEWVQRVLSGTRHVPFTRVKSQYANLTQDEARAKGYIKGNLKKEEFFGLTQRTTEPQTIYKKQKLDRDDILDITSFDVVLWLKGEMRLMLDEEIARAILLGDGRDPGDEDKIREDRIRPIATDADFYNTKVYANIDDANSSMEEVMDVLTLNRRHYRGSGNPTFFTSETFLAKCLMVKDGVQRRVYNTAADVAANLRVSEIVTVEILDEPTTNVVGILVNLQDYTVGTDQGGEVSLFDDFDIDYNQYKYLIETRLSGALVKAKSAITVLKTNKTDVLVDPAPPAYNKTNHTVTVANTTGIDYKNKATNATLTSASPVTLAPGDELTVVAVPKAGYYIQSSMGDEYNYTYDDGRVADSLY